jgi:hypothetical protein
VPGDGEIMRAWDTGTWSTGAWTWRWCGGYWLARGPDAAGPLLVVLRGSARDRTILIIVSAGVSGGVAVPSGLEKRLNRHYRGADDGSRRAGRGWPCVTIRRSSRW